MGDADATVIAAFQFAGITRTLESHAHVPTHDPAIPRRPCRQPAAPAALKEARAEARERRDLRRSAEGDRGSRDRAIIKKQEAVGLQVRSPTANSAARRGRPISSAALHGVEAYARRAQDQVPGRRQPKPMMLRVIGKLGGYRRIR